MDTYFPNPHDKDIMQLEEGLAFRAIKSGDDWILPSGKNAFANDPVVVDGVFGYATATIVGGTDSITENTNWKPYGDCGALGTFSRKTNPKAFASVASLAELQTFLVNKVGEIQDLEIVNIEFITSTAFDPFASGRLYTAVLTRNASNYFSALCYPVNGDGVIVNVIYNGGTWHVRDYVQNRRIKCWDTSCYSLSDVKTHLLTVASELAHNAAQNVSFWVGGTSDPFVTGVNYTGMLRIAFKGSDQHIIFSCTLAGSNGDAIVVGYDSDNGGTWNIEKLALNSKLTLKQKSFTPTAIAADAVGAYEDTTIKNAIVVGYKVAGVSSTNIAITECYSDGNSVKIVIKNNGSGSITASNITVYYI